MPISLVAQATYHAIECGLFKNDTCLEKTVVLKQLASKNFITHIQQILTHHQLTIPNLSFIGANLGPAPFTTLRVLIATINGIGFATHIPLVGVDGLATLAHKTADPTWPHTVVLLNAYHNDVYYTYHEHTGCCALDGLLTQLNQAIPEQQLRFVGDGALQHARVITDFFGQRACIDEQAPTFASLDDIAQQALTLYQAGKTQQQLFPLYLKSTITP